MEIADLGEDDDVTDIPKITIGLCAMNKKTNSRPMKEIVTRIVRLGFFDVKVFNDDVILREPVENWPLCDCLISFFSYGFPLEKAIAYAKLRKPFLLNDLEMQYDLHDRCKVYDHLRNAGIETPRNAILRRDDDGNVIGPDLVETEDSVQIGNTVFHKPFVEKPLDAEDHSVYIYYPTSAGGGSQRLFRKVGSRSSVYSRQSCVRRTGSYIYEDFVPTDGTDVKVYTVGPEYAHAEARKSPSLDGKVERDSQGKEVRYPVILSQYEKEIANKVCTVFKQSVCGFDLLRTHGKSYVCDVNGFSFVKTSKKYYDDCAMVISSMILLELAPQLYMPYIPDYSTEDMSPKEGEDEDGSNLELRCVVGIIRHGDRTPKQKLKMVVRHPKFIELFRKHGGSSEHDLKLKKPKEMQEVLDIARELLQEIKNGEQLFEKCSKLNQIKSVLEMYGYFSGINRKVQLKYLGRANSRTEGQKAKHAKENHSRTESGEFALLLILKWGGELTKMGRAQAEQLGEAFRWMYPESQDEYTSGGLLRLHSTYRHDLKIYASDEGRVQMTAAAFAKGFLDLEGELTPILVHLVRSDKNVTQMLDTSVDAARIMGKVKRHLHEIMHKDEDFSKEDFDELAPTQSHSLIDAMKKVKNPRQTCEKLYSLVQGLTTQLKEMINNKVTESKKPYLYHGESLEMMTHRWTKLEKDFKLKNGGFDISLIPDLYDCIKYDVQHNSNLGLNNTMELYHCAKSLADIVIPQEYGISKEEKLDISERVCFRLLRKIRADLKHADISESTTRLNPQYSRGVGSPHRHVRTRLYFTSESHIHTVTNALRCAKLFDEIHDTQWQRAINYLEEVSELNYMTQIVFMLYEDPIADPHSDHKFHLSLHFSSGARTIDDPGYVGSPVRVLGDASDGFDPGILSPWGEFVKGPKDENATGDKDGASTSDNTSNQGVHHVDGINGDTHRSMQKDPSFCNKDPHECSIDSKLGSCSSIRSDDSLCQTINSPSSFTNSYSYSSLDQYEDNVDKPFDENLFGFNELPRCSIGGSAEGYFGSEREKPSSTLVEDDQINWEGNQVQHRPRVGLFSIPSGHLSDQSVQCDSDFVLPRANGEVYTSSDVSGKATSGPLPKYNESEVPKPLYLPFYTSRKRIRSKSEGDLYPNVHDFKLKDIGARKLVQSLRETMKPLQDMSGVAAVSTEKSNSRTLNEAVNKDTKDYYQLLDTYTLGRPRKGSEDGPEFAEEIKELLRFRRFKSWPNSLSDEKSEDKSQKKCSKNVIDTSSEAAVDKNVSPSNTEGKNIEKSAVEDEETSLVTVDSDLAKLRITGESASRGENTLQSSKSAIDGLTSSDKTIEGQRMHETQSCVPGGVKEAKRIDHSPTLTETGKDKVVKDCSTHFSKTTERDLILSNKTKPGLHLQGKQVLKARWSLGGLPVIAKPDDKLSPPMQALQISPPAAVLKTILPTLQGIRKKTSYGMKRNPKVRQQPGFFTIPEEKNYHPPVSDFWRLTESLNPLLVLHDSIPLKQMDRFLDTLSKNSPKNTPQGSPRRMKRSVVCHGK